MSRELWMMGVSLITLFAGAITGPAFANDTVNLGVAAAGAPACAASANGTAHLICVISDAKHNLFAVSALTTTGKFATPPLDPATGNPLALGVTGGVWPEGCASTADATGDIVCAYDPVSTTAQLKGIRFNIFSGKIYPPQSLGVSNEKSPPEISCLNGNQRFTVAGPPTQESPAGATICVSRSNIGSGSLTAIAFNPATGYLATQFLGRSSSFPSCVNANDFSNVAICVFDFAGTLESVAFDPRSSPQFFALDSSLFPNITIGSFDNLSCDAPNDGSGDVLCGIIDSSMLKGFAVNPRTKFVSGLQTLVSGTGNSFPISAPSCRGVGDGSGEVICGFDMWAGTSDQIEAIKFDPRTGALSAIDAGGVQNITGLSCTFQNINAAQVSCGVVSGSTLRAQIFNP